MIDIYTKKKESPDWILKNDLYFNLYDTRVKRSEVRRKLACRRIFDLGARQKHE